MLQFRKGKRVAIDVGKARIGVAICDQDGILASPLAVVARRESLDESVREVLDQFADQEVIEAYVGLPTSLRGGATASTEDAIAFATAFEAATDLDVRLIDERLTTVSASNALQASGKNTKMQRGVIDAVAACLILEQAIAIERSQFSQPGLSLEQHAKEKQ